MRLKSVWLSLLVVMMLAAMVFLAACGQEAEVEDPDEPETPADPVDEAEEDEGPKEGGVLVIGLGADTVSMDYHLMSCWPSRQAIQYMYDPLLRLDQDEELQPILATSWEAVDDGLAYVFHLRDDVTFHDGTRFDAEAVKFNFERILDPEVGSLHLSRWDEHIESIEVLDDFTVKFNLFDIYVDFLEQMTWSSGILSPTAVEAAGEDFARNPVGAGPFMFKEYVPGSHIDYVRFDDYWGGTPYLDGLKVRIIPEASTRVIETEAGNLDMVYGVEPKDIPRLEDAGVLIEDRVTPSYQMVALNLADGPTAELEVRRAIARAIDVQLIIDEVLLGAAEVSRAGVPSASPFYHADVPMPEFDVAEAEQILDGAGWVMGDDGIRHKDGEPLEIIILTSDSELRVLYSQIIQEQLNRIGFDAEIVSLEWGTYLDAIRAGEYHVSWWSLGGFAHRIGTGTGNLHSDTYWNVSQIARQPALAEVSQQVDDIIDTVLETVDYSKRVELIGEFQQIAYDHQLKFWLWHGISHNPVQPWVQGYHLYNYNIFWLEDAWLDK